MKKIHLLFGCLFMVLISCKSKEAASGEEEVAPEEVRTPVTVTSIETTELNDYVELNATSAYQQSNFIKSSANGYLTSVKVKLGQMVYAGQQTFTLQTKE